MDHFQGDSALLAGSRLLIVVLSLPGNRYNFHVIVKWLAYLKKQPLSNLLLWSGETHCYWKYQGHPPSENETFTEFTLNHTSCWITLAHVVGLVDHGWIAPQEQIKNTVASSFSPYQGNAHNLCEIKCNTFYSQGNFQGTNVKTAWKTYDKGAKF